MRLSIITPVYNVAPYLRGSLDSVLSQTIKDWECICIDDGSTDGSGSILDEYAAKDNRFVVIHQGNKGVSETRQVGLDIARGKFVGWIDADDLCEPDHFSRLVDCAESSGADLVWCDVVEEDVDSGVSKIVRQDCIEDASELLVKIITHEFRGSLWGKLFRRSVIDSLGARFPTRAECEIMEDNYFLYLFLSGGPTIRHVGEASYRYMIRQGSLSNKNMTTKWWQQVISANNALSNLLREKGFDKAMEERLAMFKSWMLADKNVTDDMFYGFYPGLKWISQAKLTFRQRVLAYTTAFGGRNFVLSLTGR